MDLSAKRFGWEKKKLKEKVHGNVAEVKITFYLCTRN